MAPFNKYAGLSIDQLRYIALLEFTQNGFVIVDKHVFIGNYTAELARRQRHGKDKTMLQWCLQELQQIGHVSELKEFGFEVVTPEEKKANVQYLSRCTFQKEMIINGIRFLIYKIYHKMKMIITPKDVRHLTGKFILQVNSENEDYTITPENWNFVSEKRLSLVSGLSMVGMFHIHRQFNTEEEFAEYFNNYVESAKGKRFHRLLTSREIDFVASKIKEQNY